MPQFSRSSLGWFQRLCWNDCNVHYWHDDYCCWWLLFYLKRKQKQERVLSMDLLYTHIGVRCGNTVIIVVFIISECCWATLDFRVKRHGQKFRTTAYRGVASGVLSLSIHCFLQMDSHQKCENRKNKINLSNNRPFISYWGHDPKRMPYRQLVKSVSAHLCNGLNWKPKPTSEAGSKDKPGWTAGWLIFR